MTAAPNFVTDDMEQQLRECVQITPSAINPWYGAWEPGSTYTNQQLRELVRLGLDPETVDKLNVHVKVTAREMWWPTTVSTPVRRVPCPVVGHRADRLRVIAPQGAAKLVYATGELTRPRTRRVGGWIGRG